MELETSLNPSILWILTIICCKNLTKYILNLTKFDFFLDNFFFIDVVALLKWQKLAMRKKLSNQYNHLISNNIFVSQHESYTNRNDQLHNFEKNDKYYYYFNDVEIYFTFVSL